MFSNRFHHRKKTKGTPLEIGSLKRQAMDLRARCFGGRGAVLVCTVLIVPAIALMMYRRYQERNARKRKRDEEEEGDRDHVEDRDPLVVHGPGPGPEALGDVEVVGLGSLGLASDFGFDGWDLGRHGVTFTGPRRRPSATRCTR